MTHLPVGRNASFLSVPWSECLLKPTDMIAFHETPTLDVKKLNYTFESDSTINP